MAQRPRVDPRPVAAELPPAWAEVPSREATVAVGWQGLIRELVPGEPVRHLRPERTDIVARGDLVGISRDDVDGRSASPISTPASGGARRSSSPRATRAGSSPTG